MTVLSSVAFVNRKICISIHVIKVSIILLINDKTMNTSVEDYKT